MEDGWRVVAPLKGQWHCSLWSLNTSILASPDHIPWPLAYAPMAAQEVTLSPETTLRQAGEAQNKGCTWSKLAAVLASVLWAHQVGQGFLACGPIILYPCLPVPGGEVSKHAACACHAPCHHPRLPSLANAAKAILPLPLQPQGDKSHGSGDGKEGAKLYL